MRTMVWAGSLAAAALLIGSGASGQDASLVIDGTSTIRSWSCEAGDFTVSAQPATGFEEGVLKGESALETLTLTFPVGEIECGNDKMNDHLRSALKAKDFPRITYTLSRYQLEKAAEGVAVSADGELTIAGSTQPVAMAVTVVKDVLGRLRVRGEQAIRMTEFGVKPPSLMLGTIKVGDEVQVTFDVLLGAAEGTSVGAVDGTN